ncbi:M48 family metallopeptidase [Mycoplasmatota bacterium]|nr:M48 family metallopeptidase [Mycoplasmatota bacterium]
MVFKKGFYLGLVIIILMIITSCHAQSNSDLVNTTTSIESTTDDLVQYTKEDVINRLTIYTEKLSSMYNEQDEISTVFTEANESIYYPEDFSFYSNKRSKRTLSDDNIIILTSRFLNPLINYLKDETSFKLNTYFSMNKEEYKYDKYMISLSEEYMIIKRMDIFEIWKKSVKLSITEDNKLTIKVLESTEDNSRIFYTEFSEEQYKVYIRAIQNYVDYEYYPDNSYEFYRYSGTKTEGKIRWFNPETNIYHSLELLENNTISSEILSFYNLNGQIFLYTDSDTSDEWITLKWNLVDTTGWDYAQIYEHNSENNSVYKDDENILDGYKINRYLYQSAIYAEKDFIQEELNADIVTLHQHGIQLNDTSITYDNLISQLHFFKNNYKTISNDQIINPLNINFFTEKNYSKTVLSIIDSDLIFEVYNDDNYHPVNVRIYVLSIIILAFIFNTWLSILNYKHRDGEIPEEILDVYDQEAYQKWLQYDMKNFRLSILSRTVRIITIITLLIFSVFPIFNRIILKSTSSVHLQAVLLFGSYFLIEFIIALFFSIYKHFSFEEKYGLKKSTNKTIVYDKFKKLFLTIVLGGVIIYLLSLLYYHDKNIFYFYTWLLIVIIVLFVHLFYVKLFVPIFNKLTPLEDGELKNKIIHFVEKEEYEITKISVIDSSKRSTRMFAYFYGFGKFKKLVLSNTLIENMNSDQVVSVLAHQIGHTEYKHNIYNIIIKIVYITLFFVILLFSVRSDSISIAFGFNNANLGFGMIIFLLLLSPISIILQAIKNSFSRKFEYEADYYAAVNGFKDEIQEALIILAREKFTNLTPHPIYVTMKYSHPPIAYRIKAIRKIED